MAEQEQVYSTSQAAEYCGLALDSFKYHIYDAKPAHLQPDIQLGKELGFYKSTLDDFMRRHQSPDYTLKEAAAYLGVSLHRMRNHVYHNHTLRPTGKRGRLWTYSKAALDAARPIITATPRQGGDN
jgi:hypothetical protein